MRCFIHKRIGATGNYKKGAHVNIYLSSESQNSKEKYVILPLI